MNISVNVRVDGGFLNLGVKNLQGKEIGRVSAIRGLQMRCLFLSLEKKFLITKVTSGKKKKKNQTSRPLPFICYVSTELLYSEWLVAQT